MGNFETLIYEKENGIGRVTINRPEALNAYNIQMRDDLFQVLCAIKEDNEVNVAVFKGSGEKAFCAGADLSEFLTAPSPIVARRVRFQRDVWGLFLSVPQPLIAALHGYVLGSGLEIALCCDIRIASEDAVFGLPEIGLGIIPAAGGTQTLPRAIGRARALEMLLTNRWVKAEEAHRSGLVNRIVPTGKLYDTVEALAEKINAHDPMAVRNAKQAVHRGMELPLREALALEKRLAARLVGSAAGRKDSYGRADQTRSHI